MRECVCVFARRTYRYYIIINPIKASHRSPLLLPPDTVYQLNLSVSWSPPVPIPNQLNSASGRLLLLRRKIFRPSYAVRPSVETRTRVVALVHAQAHRRVLCCSSFLITDPNGSVAISSSSPVGNAKRFVYLCKKKKKTTKRPLPNDRFLANLRLTKNETCRCCRRRFVKSNRPLAAEGC